MEYMEEQMNRQIESGINEREHLYQELHAYEFENDLQSKRIKELESIIKEFTAKMGRYAGEKNDGIALYAWVETFKSKLNKDRT